jgi:3-oxocholest-4-en-26-oyl-CoA dehydrogenase beta subunit
MAVVLTRLLLRRMSVHGGLGIHVSYPLHRYFTAAKHHEFALGGATAQLRRIGAGLAVPGPGELRR